MDMIYVAPAAGGRVRQPERQSRVMPPEGAWVPQNAHYQRLLMAGDLSKAKPPQKSPPADAGQPAKPSNSSSGKASAASASSEE